MADITGTRILEILRDELKKEFTPYSDDIVTAPQLYRALDKAIEWAESEEYANRMGDDI